MLILTELLLKVTATKRIVLIITPISPAPFCVKKGMPVLSLLILNNNIANIFCKTPMSRWDIKNNKLP